MRLVSKLWNIAPFRPTFNAFGFLYVRLNTGSLALIHVASTCCLLLYAKRPLQETGRKYAAHLHLKRYTPKQLFFRHAPNMTFSSCYNKWPVGYFELKLHRHILGTPTTNITSCKKRHNRCPLIIIENYSELLVKGKLFTNFLSVHFYNSK